MDEPGPSNQPNLPPAEPVGHADNYTQEDSEKMWTMYMDEVGELDARITSVWKDDAVALVIFTSLFSVVVAAFTIESYKKLSPDTGGQTVDLLRSISQQLASPTNLTVPTQAMIQSPSTTTLNVCVNAMWLTSLVLSISSALFATLLQQWARRYILKPQIPRQQKRRARVRRSLHRGTETFKMLLVVEIAPFLLHLSVFLFFVGLGMFFFPIHKTVGIVVSVIVGIVGLVYLVFTILPCIKHNCPYRTPMTPFCWYTWHALLFLAMRNLRNVLFVIRLNRSQSQRSADPPDGPDPPDPQSKKYFESLERAVKKHEECLTDGLDKGTIKEAENAPEDQDSGMVRWLLDQLVVGDESKLRKFVASMPRNTITLLMGTTIESKLALCNLLLPLIRSCAVTSASTVSEDVRRQALSKCLEAVRRVIEAYSIRPNEVQEVALLYVLINIANTSLMRAMWNDADDAIRLTSRTICALLARCVIHKQLDVMPEGWMQDIIGANSSPTSGYGTEHDHIVLKFFVSGVLSNFQANLPTELVAPFGKTLAMLTGIEVEADADVNDATVRMGLENSIAWMQSDNTPYSNSIIDKLRQILPSQRTPHWHSDMHHP